MTLSHNCQGMGQFAAGLYCGGIDENPPQMQQPEASKTTVGEASPAPSGPFDPWVPRGAPVVLREATAGATGGAESSMETNADNGEAKDLQYPQPTLTANSSIRPPRRPTELSSHLTLQGLQRSRLLPLCPSSLYCHFISPPLSLHPIYFIQSYKRFSSTIETSGGKKNKPQNRSVRWFV